ncbi:MAG: hypothetical protein ACKO7W_11325 [Elainella sp.]
MVEPIRFPFTELDATMGEFSAFLYLPITLEYQNQALQLSGLLDTGASVNVLPYEIGRSLGAIWEHQRLIIPLGGNLARYEARAIVVSAKVADFAAVDLAFAWTIASDAPLILGQVNFFQMFNVCFYRADLEFEVSQRSFS